MFFASTGNDTFKGGSGNDGFIISAANLTSADTIVGGAGFDVLSITTNGTVTAANNAGVFPGIEVRPAHWPAASSISPIRFPRPR